MTVDVAVKGVTDIVSTASKETISLAVRQNPPIRKEISSQKNEATEAEIIVCDDSGDKAGGGEGETAVNSIDKISRVN